jgi:serine O-acetyltransferase
MLLSIKKNYLLEYCLNALNTYFKDGEIVSERDLKKSFNISLDKIEFCHDGIKDIKKYTTQKKQVYFDHLNTDHFCTFLYFLSNTTFKNCKSKTICTKLYYLNKIMHSVDILYSINLPKIFNLQHPIGSVIGRGKYKNYLTIYNNCTVGQNSTNSDEQPNLDQNVTLRPHSSVLGDSHIGKNSEISIGSSVYNQKVKKDSIYFGNPFSNHILKKIK